MIRKLALALGLALLGLTVLHFTIGWENFARVHESASSGGPLRAGTRGTGGVLVGGAGDAGQAAVTARISGAIGFKRRVERVRPGGERLLLPLYTMTASDSRPIEEDLMQLDGVRAELFSIDDRDELPIAVAVGTLEARQALVRVGRNDKGEPSIREDRDMDLRDVVLRTSPGSRIRELELRVANVRARHSEHGLVFETPDPREPFRLVMGGERPLTLDGRGLAGAIPDDDAHDPVLEITVRSEPRLVDRDVALQANGVLTYRETLRDGLARIELADAVVVTGLPDGERSSATARGDRLVARLTRAQRKQHAAERRHDAVWQSMTLDGSPATLESGSGRLTCARLVGAPAVDGAPSVFSASGAPALIDSATGATFTAERRIQMVRLPAWLGAIDRLFGIPEGSYGSLVHELILFEGAATILDATRGMRVEASDGIRMLRSEGTSSLLLATAAGEVRVRTSEFDATGNRGFRLARRPGGLQLRLGPEVASADHRFSVAQTAGSTGEGAPRDTLEVSGHGRCAITQIDESSFEVEIDSPLEDVAVVSSASSVRAIRRLTATLRERALRALDARGSRCELVHEIADPAGGPGMSIRGSAPHVHTGDGASFALIGGDRDEVQLARGDSDTVRGARIDVHRIDAQTLCVIARGANARVEADVPPEAGPTNRSLEVRRIVLGGSELFLLPRGDLPAEWLTENGVPAPPLAAARLPLLAESADRIVLARDRVVLTLLGDDDSVLAEANGDALYLREADRAGVLSGAPASLRRIDRLSRRSATAPTVLFRFPSGAEPALRLEPDALHLARLESYDGDTAEPFRRLRVDCDGPIDATGRDVVFLGNVDAVGLDEAGDVEADGLALSARSLNIERDAQGAARRITADGEPRMRYRHLLTHGDSISILVPRQQCDVVGTRNRASVQVGDIRSVGDFFRVHYDTLEVHAWRPSLVRDDEQPRTQRPQDGTGTR